MTKNREKVINNYNDGSFVTGYLGDDGIFIYHSFDDEPAFVYDGSKIWYKDGVNNRDNHKPAIIYSNGIEEFYNNGKRYWFINNKEYYDIKEIKEKFKNKILKLYNIDTKILKESGINTIYINNGNYLILDQSQYNLAILKFL